MNGLFFIVVLSLLAVGYARDQEAELAIRGCEKGDHTKKGPRATPTVKFGWLSVRKWQKILLTLFL